MDGDVYCSQQGLCSTSTKRKETSPHTAIKISCDNKHHCPEGREEGGRLEGTGSWQLGSAFQITLAKADSGWTSSRGPLQIKRENDQLCWRFSLKTLVNRVSKSSVLRRNGWDHQNLRGTAGFWCELQQNSSQPLVDLTYTDVFSRWTGLVFTKLFFSPPAPSRVVSSPILSWKAVQILSLCHLSYSIIYLMNENPVWPAESIPGLGKASYVYLKASPKKWRALIPDVGSQIRRLVSSEFAPDYMVEEEYFAVYCTSNQSAETGFLGEVISRQA